MYRVTNTGQGDHVVHDRRNRTITIPPGEACEVDLADEVARRWQARGGVLKVAPAEIKLPVREPIQARTAEAELGPALWNAEYHAAAPSAGGEVTGKADDAAAKIAAAHRLAAALENDSIGYHDGYAAAGDFLPPDRPRAKAKLVAALRALT